jgi:hypothetical protein
MPAGHRFAAFALLAATALVGASPAQAGDETTSTGGGSSTLDGSVEGQRPTTQEGAKGGAGRAKAGDARPPTRAERRVLRLAASVEPGTSEGAAVDQTGWWSRTNEDPPETNVVGSQTFPAPDVPEGALPVTVAGGERVRVSAVGIAVDGETGSSVDQLLLVLRESEAPNAALNADAAVVRACPITTDFWVASVNGKWARVPEHDCDAGAVDGVRDPETGTWAFDLTSLASGWLAEDFTGSRAVLLTSVTTDASGAPAQSQVMYDALDGIGLLASTSPGLDLPAGDDTDAPSGAGGVGATGGPSGSGVGTTGSSGGVGSTGGTASAPVGGDAVPPASDIAPAEDAAPTAATEAEGGLMPVAASPRPWYGGLGPGAVLLTALAMGLAYLTMLAMGPDAQPAPATTTRRGVSRALDRMRTVGADLRGRWGR